MIYYVDGNFSSRKGIEVGSITLHPSGLPHGPQPGLAEKSLGMTETHEYAVMCDTFNPLKLTTLASDLDDGRYMYSWAEDAATGNGDDGRCRSPSDARSIILGPYLIGCDRDRSFLDDVRVVVPPIEQVDSPAENRDGEQTPEPHPQDVEWHEEHGASSVSVWAWLSCG